MPDYAALRNKQNAFIRKALDGSAFLGAPSSALINNITATDGSLLALPAGMDDLGWLSTDGAQFSRDVSESTVSSWGSVTPTRTDITSDISTLTVSCQETKASTIALATGADLSAIRAQASGEVVIKKPTRPTSRNYRVLTLAVDNGDAGPIYIGRYMPRAKVTSFDAQNFSGGDDPITWGVTFTSEEDKVAGYSEAWFFGGPGWAPLVGEMGFVAA